MEKTYKILKLIILVLALVVLMLGATRLYNTLSSQVSAETLTAQPQAAEGKTESQRKQVPDFTVYDLEGNPHKLSDFLGKPVVLNFWASWCGPCQSEMPDFEEKYQEYGAQVEFMMVNMTDGGQETVESAHSFVVEKGYTFPVYFDTDMEAAFRYSVTSIPATYFVDAQGYLTSYHKGMLTAQALQTGIDQLLD